VTIISLFNNHCVVSALQFNSQHRFFAQFCVCHCTGWSKNGTKFIRETGGLHRRDVNTTVLIECSDIDAGRLFLVSALMLPLDSDHAEF